MQRFLMFLLVACLMFAVAPAVRAIPSGIGLSGGLTVPSPKTLAPERYEIAFTTEVFDERNQSTLAMESTADVSFKLNVGVYDNLEMGIERTLRIDGTHRDDSVSIQAKYRFPIDTFDLSAGLVMAASGPDYTSLYFVGGWKAVHLGFGFNFGGQQLYEVNTSTIWGIGGSKFGGYTLRRQVRTGNDIFTGHPDEFFGLFGANFGLSDTWSVLFDYNGDRFTGGFRFLWKDMHMDLAYITQSEYDSLLDRRSLNYQIAAGVKF